VGFVGKQARDAELLLLFERERGGLLVQAVLDAVPQQHFAQRAFDQGIFFAARTATRMVQPVAEQHVVADRQRQRVGPLEHHADLPPHLDARRFGRVDVVAQHADGARRRHVAEPLVDAVAAAQQRRLAAARRADQRRHDAGLDLQVDLEQRLELAVPEVEVLDLDGGRAVVGGARDAGPRVGELSQNDPPGSRRCSARARRPRTGPRWARSRRSGRRGRTRCGRRGGGPAARGW
jgi:hypothetical protein